MQRTPRPSPNSGSASNGTDAHPTWAGLVLGLVPPVRQVRHWVEGIKSDTTLHLAPILEP